MKNVPTLHVMVGLPCSGKTTYAKKLAETENALLLTPDVWHLRLFGDDVGDDSHDCRHESIEKIMWDVAKRVLELGCSAILDFGLWSRAERDDFRSRAKSLGVGFKLHYVSVSSEELLRRLEERNRTLPDGVFKIPKEEFERYMPLFQPPHADELT